MEILHTLNPIVIPSVDLEFKTQQRKSDDNMFVRKGTGHVDGAKRLKPIWSTVVSVHNQMMLE